MGAVFRKLKRLESIRFGDSCILTHLCDNYFENIQSEQNLTVLLAACPLSSFTNTSFVMGSNLSGLILDITQLTLQQVLDSIQLFKNLQEFSIKKLRQISIVDYYLEHVLEYFVETEIKKLTISGNKISFNFESGYLIVPPKLKTLITDRFKYPLKYFIDALRNTPENSLTKLEFEKPPRKQNVFT